MLFRSPPRQLTLEEAVHVVLRRSEDRAVVRRQRLRHHAPRPFRAPRAPRDLRQQFDERLQGGLRLLLGMGVKLPVAGALFGLVFLVMPGQAAAQLLQIRLRLAARVYGANSDPEGRYACLRFATHAAELSIDAWKEAATCLEDLGDKADHERWRGFLRDMRVAFNVADEDMDSRSQISLQSE